MIYEGSNLQSDSNINYLFLAKLGLSEKDASLVCNFAHWYERPKNAEERLNSFIENLMNLCKFCEREDTKPEIKE